MVKSFLKQLKHLKMGTDIIKFFLWLMLYLKSFYHSPSLNATCTVQTNKSTKTICHINLLDSRIKFAVLYSFTKVFLVILWPQLVTGGTNMQINASKYKKA